MLRFSSKGLSTGFITGQSTESMKAAVLTGEHQLVFFTPEQLLINQRVWRELLKYSIYEKRLRAVVIDEVHTVKKW